MNTLNALHSSLLSFDSAALLSSPKQMTSCIHTFSHIHTFSCIHTFPQIFLNAIEAIQSENCENWENLLNWRFTDVLWLLKRVIRASVRAILKGNEKSQDKYPRDPRASTWLEYVIASLNFARIMYENSKEFRGNPRRLAISVLLLM